jgi:Rieske Fe-S protein
MIRRTFLQAALMLMGRGRRAWAQVTATPARYVRLSEPVRIARDAGAKPWQPVAFKAEAMAPPAGGAPAYRVILRGVVFRRTAAGDRPALSALCVTCTHEQCEVDFVEQPGTLPRMDRPIDHPVFFCACHSSVFDAVDDGAWISGPAARGLYRFQLNVIGDQAVEIVGVEQEALLQA